MIAVGKSGPGHDFLEGLPGDGVGQQDDLLDLVSSGQFVELAGVAQDGEIIQHRRAGGHELIHKADDLVAGGGAVQLGGDGQGVIGNAHDQGGGDEPAPFAPRPVKDAPPGKTAGANQEDQQQPTQDQPAAR